MVTGHIPGYLLEDLSMSFLDEDDGNKDVITQIQIAQSCLVLVLVLVTPLPSPGQESVPALLVRTLIFWIEEASIRDVVCVASVAITTPFCYVSHSERKMGHKEHIIRTKRKHYQRWRGREVSVLLCHLVSVSVLDLVFGWSFNKPGFTTNIPWL